MFKLWTCYFFDFCHIFVTFLSFFDILCIFLALFFVIFHFCLKIKKQKIWKRQNNDKQMTKHVKKRQKLTKTYQKTAIFFFKKKNQKNKKSKILKIKKFKKWQKHDKKDKKWKNQ